MEDNPNKGNSNSKDDAIYVSGPAYERVLKIVDIDQKLQEEMGEAERKAFDSLARYKFQMFGYWAAIWVHLNKISGAKQPSPFKGLVHKARELGNINKPHPNWKPDGWGEDTPK